MFGTEISILEGLLITILGMGVTFAVLYFLSLLISLIKIAFYKSQPSYIHEQKDLPQAATKPKEMVVADLDTDAKAIQREQEELVAAITVAVALTLDKPAQSISIKSIARRDNASQKSSRWHDFSKMVQFDNRL